MNTQQKDALIQDSSNFKNPQEQQAKIMPYMNHLKEEQTKEQRVAMVNQQLKKNYSIQKGFLSELFWSNVGENLSYRLLLKDIMKALIGD